MTVSGINCPNCDAELPEKCVDWQMVTAESYYFPAEYEMEMARPCPSCDYWEDGWLS